MHQNISTLWLFLVYMSHSSSLFTEITIYPIYGCFLPMSVILPLCSHKSQYIHSMVVSYLWVSFYLCVHKNHKISSVVVSCLRVLFYLCVHTNHNISTLWWLFLAVIAALSRAMSFCRSVGLLVRWLVGVNEFQGSKFYLVGTLV